MNLQFYLEKLFASYEFEKFKKENPNSYFASGFLVIDKENPSGNKVHIDYFNSETKKMFSFQLENDCQVVPVEQVPEEPLEKISDNIDFSFKKIEKLIVEKMKEENVKNKIQRILLSLQKKNKKNFLLGTVFISNLGMLKINIDLDEMDLVSFEKKNFMDMFKIVKRRKNEN